MNGAGQSFFVAGGVQVLTGVSLTYQTAVGLFSGTGEMSVMAGVQIVTGLHLLDVYGVLAAYGTGLDYCLFEGVMVHVGAALSQYSGPLSSSMAGGYTFVGGGTHICIGSPSVAAQSTAQEAGIVSVFFHRPPWSSLRNHFDARLEDAQHPTDGRMRRKALRMGRRSLCLAPFFRPFHPFLFFFLPELFCLRPHPCREGRSIWRRAMSLPSGVRSLILLALPLAHWRGNLWQ
jgi:hypothetical protein